MHIDIQFIYMCNMHTHINKFSSISIAIIIYIYDMVNTHAMYLQYQIHQIHACVMAPLGFPTFVWPLEGQVQDLQRQQKFLP